MATSGMEIERLYATVGVDLSELRGGLMSAKADTRAATADMAGSFDTAATRIDNASKRVTASAGAQRQAMRQLSFQVGDVTSSLASGISPMMVFAQQGDQVRIAVSEMAGESSKLAAFMGGPWGAAIFGAATILGLLISSLWDSADAKKEVKKQADALADAEKRLAQASAIANHQTRQGILDDIERAKSLRVRRIETLETLKAELLLAKQKAGAAGAAVGRGGPSYANMFLIGEQAKQEATARNIDAQIAATELQIKKTNGAINVGLRKLADREIAARTDPTTAANQRLEDAQDKFAREVESGRMSLSDYRATLIRETKIRDAAIEALNDASKDERNSSRARNAAAAEARKLERERQRDENRAYRLDNQYRRALASATQGLISAQLGLASTAEERARLETEQLKARREQADEEILSNRDYSEAQKARLVALNEETGALQQRKIDLDLIAAQTEREIQLIKDAADLEEIKADTSRELLQQEASLARTAQTRQEIALQIVQLDHDLAVARQQEIIASNMRKLASLDAAQADSDAAPAARSAIDKAEATISGMEQTLPGSLRRARLDNPNLMDPEDFGRDLGNTLERGILEALQGKNLMDAMRDGLTQLLSRAIADSFAELSQSVFGEEGLGGLLANLFGSVLGGLTGGGAGGGDGAAKGINTGISLALSAFGKSAGARAVGGPTIAGRAYDVGTGEKFVASANGRILSRADAMRAVADGARLMPQRQGDIYVSVPGAMSKRDARETGYQVGRAARSEMARNARVQPA